MTPQSLHSLSARYRQGSVLARSTILKRDHFPRGIHTGTDSDDSVEFYLDGAPNFRQSDLNVFGVSQPTRSGLVTVLTVLLGLPVPPTVLTPGSITSTSSASSEERSVLWFNTREEPLIYIHGKPYVLRDAETPKQNIRTYSGISADRLEMMEERLKEDIIRESKKCQGVLLVHDELEDGRIVPACIGIGAQYATVIQTPKEVFQMLIDQGYPVRYHRIPISPEQRPEDKYLDEYVQLMAKTDLRDAVVFNCGLGVGRTTFGMVSALLIRRRQMMDAGQGDPYDGYLGYTNGFFDGDDAGTNGTLSTRLDAEMDKMAMLRLVYVLERGLNSKMSPHSAIEWMLARSRMIDHLKSAILGNYTIMQKLASVLEHGSQDKKLLDLIINRCDELINLREEILMSRVRYSVHAQQSQVHGQPAGQQYQHELQKALGMLERYFFLLCFAAYLRDQDGSVLNANSSHTELDLGNHVVTEVADQADQEGRERQTFALWLKQRPEIQNMLELFRNKTKPSLLLFRPVEDFSIANLPKGMASTTGLATAASAVNGDKVVDVGAASGSTGMTELEDMVIRSRNGSVLNSQTILKLDVWVQEGSIQGAPNFRIIPGGVVFGSAQPTLIGFEQVLKHVWETNAEAKIIWVNLREEPIVYINGTPYVLRDQYFTLRNIKSYTGITQSRLELLEARLKEDIVKESHQYEGRLLLHEESKKGDVKGTWRAVHPENVRTVTEVVEAMAKKYAGRFEYSRVPITAEAPPEEKDFDQVMKIVCKAGLNKTAFVMNCQIGMGRSTTGTVISSLVLKWLKNESKPSSTHTVNPNMVHYQVIHSLLRVIKDGLECKRIVDETIDKCAINVNIRDHIEYCRVQAENAANEEDKKRYTSRGLQSLHRYFLLVAFQSYLNQHQVESMDDLETFEEWVKAHEEFGTMVRDMEIQGAKALLPVGERLPGDGLALSSEVEDVVDKRSGAVLAQQMILKFDHFPGCQKMNLAERIEGAPNFRIVDLRLMFVGTGLSFGFKSHQGLTELGEVYGVAMPTKDAIKSVLKRVDAGPGGKRKLVWTSLREEPVLYVNRNPYVLRLARDPLKNLETTGIERERVELMENRMKKDAIEELQRYGGRLLLHEEESSAGGFQIVPVWETVKEADVLTPSEVFESLIKEGYKVDYLRIPVTDEQAPIPRVFDLMMSRVGDTGGQTDVLFNCQMGRGRTTTGMVIACVLKMVRNGGILEDHSMVSPPVAEDELAESFSAEDDEKKLYHRGEYKIILRLLRVLKYGKLSKKLIDKAIDSCNHIQNIRIAIYDYRLRLAACEVGSKAYESILGVGVNYLIRYFYLVVFASYVVEKEEYLLAGNSNGEYPLFSAWLTERREITSILTDSIVDLG